MSFAASSVEFNSTMENHYSFIFNTPSISSNGTIATQSQEINLEPYQAVVIEGLHNNVKSLHKKLDETNTMLTEMKQINMFNVERVNKLKEEGEMVREKEEDMRKTKEDIEKLEKKLEEHQEAIKILIDDRFKEEAKTMEEPIQDPIVEEEPVEEVYVDNHGSNLMATSGSSWCNGLFGPVLQTTRNGLTVFGYQGPRSASEAYNFGITTNLARYAQGFKQRPVNYYSQPARKFKF